MPDYGITKNIIVVTPDGIIAVPSGSKTNQATAISASIPQILAVTCSSNFNNRLTKLTTLNAFGTITLASGSSNFRDTRIILRYTDSSSFRTSDEGIFRNPKSTNEDNSEINLKFTGSKINDTFVDIPINNNDDSFLVAYRTVEALKTSKVFQKSFSISLVDDGSSQSIISASLGSTMKVGSSFKVRNSASLGITSLTDGAEGKFIITSINSGSVALPDFSGTATQVGGMQVGSSFRIGSTEPVFQFNIIQSGSGKTNQRFYPGRISANSSSLIQRIDPEDKKSFEFLIPSQSAKSDEDLIAFYISSSQQSAGQLRLGLGTKDPVTDVDIRADEFQVQRKNERKGLKINNEGNIESFDRNAATAATGSEFLLNFSRGIEITKLMLTVVAGIPSVDDDDAVATFNALSTAAQQKILINAERKGFIQPPQTGDTLGAIRWVTESGSIGTLNRRTTGETAVIKAVVSDADTTGVQADLIFSVAGKTGASEQKFLLDAGDEHEMTGSLEVFGNVKIAGQIRPRASENGNTRIDFANSGVDIKFNSDTAQVLSLSSTAAGVVFNESGNDIDFRIESDDDSKAFYINAGINAIQLGSAATTHVTASGNISASGTLFASRIVTNEITSSFITSSTSILIQNFTSSGDSDFQGNITSSGNISSSGIITALSSNIVTIDGGFF